MVAEGTPAALKATVGSQSLVVHLGHDTPPDAITQLRDALAARPDVARVLVADRTLSLQVDDGATLAPQILHAVERHGIAPRSIAITQPTLEDVYLRYTGRAFDGDIRSAA